MRDNAVRRRRFWRPAECRRVGASRAERGTTRAGAFKTGWKGHGASQHAAVEAVENGFVIVLFVDPQDADESKAIVPASILAPCRFVQGIGAEFVQDMVAFSSRGCAIAPSAWELLDPKGAYSKSIAGHGVSGYALRAHSEIEWRHAHFRSSIVRLSRCSIGSGAMSGRPVFAKR